MAVVLSIQLLILCVLNQMFLGKQKALSLNMCFSSSKGCSIVTGFPYPSPASWNLALPACCSIWAILKVYKSSWFIVLFLPKIYVDYRIQGNKRFMQRSMNAVHVQLPTRISGHRSLGSLLFKLVYFHNGYMAAVPNTTYLMIFLTTGLDLIKHVSCTFMRTGSWTAVATWQMSFKHN